MSTTEKTGEEMISSGIAMVEREYREAVSSYARDIAEACWRGEIEDNDHLVDYINETCDGSEWVIYTFKARLVLLVSDNEDAGIEALGADGFDWSAGIPWSALAYFAFEMDVSEALDRVEGFDRNSEPEEWTATAEPIPADWPVQPLDDDETPPRRTTCGHCGLSWDDGIITSMTPAPSARCPFEMFHIHHNA